MAAAIPLPALAPSTDPAASGGRAARAAFARVFNLRTIAVVYFFVLVLLLGRQLLWLSYEPFEPWFYATVRGIRQSLISALLLLLASACVEAVVAAFRIRPRAALALGLTVAVLAAAGAIPLRVWAVGNTLTESLARDPFYPFYLLQIGSLWAVIGGFGYWLFHTLRTDELARAQLADAECSRESLQAQMVEARLSALQAQIEPHFLFNTLANVKRLYETAPQRGREMLSSLISYLRAALPTMREPGSTLGREIELVRAFLRILQMRMGERLSFSIVAADSLGNARVPPMVLPTLVENAIKHGLSPLPEGGHIEIRARSEDDRQLVIDVVDNGAGFSASGGSGVGLANTRSRLAALYGAEASLSLAIAAPRGVIATVRLPLEVASS